jgi:hypothetical protein
VIDERTLAKVAEVCATGWRGRSGRRGIAVRGPSIPQSLAQDVAQHGAISAVVTRTLSRSFTTNVRPGDKSAGDGDLLARPG